MKNEMSTTHPLLEAHDSLMESMKQLQEQILECRHSMEVLRGQVAVIRTAVLEHFRLEEEDGYMKQVLELRPFLERSAEKLRHEHRDLAAELDAILKELYQPKSDVRACCVRLENWIGRIHLHEKQENMMVEDAFGLDIGTKD